MQFWGDGEKECTRLTAGVCACIFKVDIEEHIVTTVF